MTENSNILKDLISNLILESNFNICLSTLNIISKILPNLKSI